MYRETTSAKVRDNTSAKVGKPSSEPDSTAPRHHELLASNCRILKAREEENDKADDTPVKIRTIHDNKRKVTVNGLVAKWVGLRKRVGSLTNDLESKF